MCGILGAVGTQARQRVSDDLFYSALRQLDHRGPDGHGIATGKWGLFGHRRLSIIDLSDNARQPMRDPETGVLISFNGEIYNYLEIRAELSGLGQRFLTSSDTEVLLGAYLRWGDDCFRKLNGMFAIAIYDPRDDVVLLVRDRFGVKPLYYTLETGLLSFASEPKALIALGTAKPEQDDIAVADFLYGGVYARRERCFVGGVSRLDAAHCMTFNVQTSASRTWAYWNYPIEALPSGTTTRAALEEFTAIFESAVQLRQRSDVPVALSLSGGLDSSAILTSMAKTAAGAPLSFTSTYDVAGTDESPWARKAAAAVAGELRECPVRSQDWLETLTSCTFHLDGPAATPSIVPVWELMRQVKQRGIKVLLEGQGADELFGGYVQYTSAQLCSMALHPRLWPKAVALASSGTKLFGLTSLVYNVAKDCLPDAIRAYRSWAGHYGLLHPDIVKTGRDDIFFLRNERSTRSGVDRRLWLDHSRLQLPRLLHYGDALSMAHGIETRMPFLDYRLVEWTFKLPVRLRLAPDTSKWMIRSYLRENGQDQIALRTDKKGYPTPYIRWIADLTPTQLHSLLPADAPVFQYVDRQRFLRALRDRDPKSLFGANLLFRILALQIWLKQLPAYAQTPGATTSRYVETIGRA